MAAISANERHTMQRVAVVERCVESAVEGIQQHYVVPWQALERKPEEITSDENTEEDDKTSSASVNSVNMGSNVTSLCVVPVKVGYKGTDKVAHTYAFLDNCN